MTPDEKDIVIKYIQQIKDYAERTDNDWSEIDGEQFRKWLYLWIAEFKVELEKSNA